MKEEKKVFEVSKETSVKLPLSVIWELPELKKYSKDYIRVLLPNKDGYTEKQAIDIVKKYFNERSE